MKQLMVCAMILVLAACTPASVTNVWKAPDAAPPPFRKIMVMGLVRDEDHSVCERLEAHFAGDLAELGYSVVSAYQQYGPRAFVGLKEEEAITKIRQSGVDAVITIVLLDKSREKYYVPARVYYTPYTVYSNRFWGYYSTMYGRIYEPGYYRVDTRYFLESNLYDLKHDKLLYSIQTQSFDPASAEDLGHTYGKVIVKNMVKDGLLKKQPAYLSKLDR